MINNIFDLIMYNFLFEKERNIHNFSYEVKNQNKIKNINRQKSYCLPKRMKQNIR